MACEKCWNDAYIRWATNPHKSQAEHYQDLIFERRDNWCTPEEQIGKAISKAYDDEEDCGNSTTRDLRGNGTY